jgi:hypothetical protein
MPHAAHPEFIPPTNLDAVIWRYMDLGKFLSLLEKSALFFPRLDKLAASDPYEGYYPKPNQIIGQLKYADAPPELLSNWNVKNEAQFKEVTARYRSMEEFGRKMLPVTFVNSWHALPYESAAMWAAYVKNHEGIAIQSTYRALTEVLRAHEEFDVYVGMVNYIDYETEGFEFGQVFRPMMHKRRSFAHEQELRALIWTIANKKNDEHVLDRPDLNWYKDKSGLYIDVDLNVLISRIFVAPTAPTWFVELLTSLVKRYGLRKDIVHSYLASSPLK